MFKGSFKNFVRINDDQENVLKVIKGTKCFDEEISRIKNNWLDKWI